MVQMTGTATTQGGPMGAGTIIAQMFRHRMQYGPVRTMSIHFKHQWSWERRIPAELCTTAAFTAGGHMPGTGERFVHNTYSGVRLPLFMPLMRCNVTIPQPI